MTELQVFSVIGDGSDDEVAASRLEMNVHTIHTHRRNIMKKLGVQTRTELMKEAIRRGIVRITAENVIRPGFDFFLREDGGTKSRNPITDEDQSAARQ